MAPGDDSQAPATALVLKPEKLFQHFAIAKGVVISPYKIPLPAKRPGPGQIALLERIATEAVGDVEDLVACRPILQPRLGLRRAGIAGAPLLSEIEVPVL